MICTTFLSKLCCVLSLNGNRNFWRLPSTVSTHYLLRIRYFSAPSFPVNSRSRGRACKIGVPVWYKPLLWPSHCRLVITSQPVSDWSKIKRNWVQTYIAPLREAHRLTIWHCFCYFAKKYKIKQKSNGKKHSTTRKKRFFAVYLSSLKLKTVNYMYHFHHKWRVTRGTKQIKIPWDGNWTCPTSKYM